VCSFLNMIAGAAAGQFQANIQNAQNYAQYTIDSAKTDAANLLSQDQADNANTLRNANNAFLAAQASLSNTQRSISNMQKTQAAGDRWNTTVTNQNRALDAMVRGNLEQQISAAATLGAVRADAAARGVGGSSADIVRAAVAGRNARLIVGQKTQMAQTTFDDVMVQSGLRSNLIEAPDYGNTVAQLNYQAAIPTTYFKPMRQADLSDAQAQLLGAAGGGGFQQFRQGGLGSGGGGLSYSQNQDGTVGFSSDYSSQSILDGVDSVNAGWGNASGGGNTYGFDSGMNSGSGSDWNLGGGGSNSFNFTLD